ncbi:hypothetical protein DRE_06819 [Drechslerella stenobrocha 248]|uniref:Uncharacterized protein n=1 Tax=Drechslerella stenobrocha 248 TaxID=1043628 RepID=W7HK99_9PEZI|nr:hypothetical protein DRE_06819 [Drechslerella stenobrocha 248]
MTKAGTTSPSTLRASSSPVEMQASTTQHYYKFVVFKSFDQWETAEIFTFNQVDNPLGTSDIVGRGALIVLTRLRPGALKAAVDYMDDLNNNPDTQLAGFMWCLRSVYIREGDEGEGFTIVVELVSLDEER